MEKIISNPGLQHLAEKVFWNLDVEDLRICGQINQSCKQILKNPMFWLRKFRYLSQESQKDWIKIIQSRTSSDCEKIIIPYMQRSLKMGFGIDSTLFGKPNQRYRHQFIPKLNIKNLNMVKLHRVEVRHEVNSAYRSQN